MKDGDLGAEEESGPGRVWARALVTWKGRRVWRKGRGKQPRDRRDRGGAHGGGAAERGLSGLPGPRTWRAAGPENRASLWSAPGAAAVGKLAPRVATGTPEPNGGGGNKIDSSVEIAPSSNGVGTLGDAVPGEQLQGERARAGGDGLGSSLSLAVPAGPLSFEALLAQVGALGGGQQLQLGLCCLPVLFVALGLASDPIFTLAPPLHCHYGALPPNASAPGWEQPPNASGPPGAALAASAASRLATSTDPACSGFAPPDFNHCLKDWDYNGLPVLTTNAIGQWDLVCDLGWQVILEQILFILGFAAGYLFLGYPADRFGRRGTVLLALGLVGPCGVGGAAAGSSTGVMALRFLLGFLLAGVDLGVYLMRLELCDPTQRLRVALAGELVGVGGHFLFLGLALVSKDWRFLQRMITAPCILFLFYGWPGLFLESARWLIVKRQIEEAQSVLRILAERNRPHGQMLGEEAQEALQELENTCPLPATSAFSFASLLNYRNLWKNLLILGFTNFIAHALRHCYQPVGGGGSPSDFYLGALLASGAAALACVFLGVTADRFGRRGVLLLCVTLTGLASLVLLGLWDYLNEAAVTAFSVLGLFSSQAAAILSTLLACEVVPTTVRGRGLGLILALGALGGLSGPAQRLHMGHGAFLQHVVLAACALLCILSVLLLPETRRQLLPEGLRDAEPGRRPSLPPHAPPGRCDHVPLLAPPHPAL
ncbi:solute carrier family 22 member 17 [Perognathus longimembris pacificus]|uniref:solute carrier family 22 member 17 n=1 Tax=Perognathus longimembris pacificus TaxID=214514 RepID=UPI002018FCEE|nr:solute carrier family 22 member 17 [Perognathus longimembris pacificus]